MRDRVQRVGRRIVHAEADVSTWLFDTATLLVALQATDAAIVGQVRDADSGEPVAGVVITLTDIARTTISDSLGRYTLASIPPGPHHVTVRRIGYSIRALRALVPRTGELRLDIALRRDPLRLPSIAVRPSETRKGAAREPLGDSDRSVSDVAIRDHPLLAEPDAFMALAGGSVVLRAESPSGMHLGGGASDQTAYLLDGIPVFNPYHVAGTFSAFNPDALERVGVSWRPGAASTVEALSGTVAASTRTAASRPEVQASLSTTQARITLHGPAGLPGSTYLIGVRTGFPGFIAPEREPSYLHGESGDLVAKVEMPVLGGRGRVLVYDNANEIGAAADATSDASTESAAPPRRHDFEWHSRSAGLDWHRAIGQVGAAVQAWSAATGAEALWHAEAGEISGLMAHRRDIGVVASATHAPSVDTRTVASVRVRSTRTRYEVGVSDADSLSLVSRLPVTSLFIEHQRPIAHRLSASLGLTASLALGRARLGPQALLRWRPSSTFVISVSYARSHQFAQSLRNTESIIGTVFPADLFVGSNTPGVPVARADNAVVAAEAHPIEGMRLAAQGYVRRSTGLLLAAPRSPEPFATRAFTTGAALSRGVSLEAALSATRFGVMTSYGWQQVRVGFDTLHYAPEHATDHLLEAGALVRPSLTSSIRIGVTAGVGRRASGLAGSLETEACNLIDRGCELAGTPRLVTDGLGASKLPPYVRVDVGARKHWDIELAGRTATVGLFGTVTNVLGRRNVIAVVAEPTTGARTTVGMRPLAPLVVGVDWRF